VTIFAVTLRGSIARRSHCVVVQRWYEAYKNIALIVAESSSAILLTTEAYRCDASVIGAPAETVKCDDTVDENMLMCCHQG
jgi:hypothetical protein